MSKLDAAVLNSRLTTAPLMAPQTSPDPAMPPPKTEVIRIHDVLNPGSGDSRLTRIITLSAQLYERPSSSSIFFAYLPI